MSCISLAGHNRQAAGTGVFMDDMDIAQEQTVLGMERVLRDRRARTTVVQGPIVARDCASCGEPIPMRRLQASPGCTRCVDCMRELERA